MKGLYLIDFKFKNKLQDEFIDKYKEKREWIFTPITKSQMNQSKNRSYFYP